MDLIEYIQSESNKHKVPQYLISSAVSYAKKFPHRDPYPVMHMNTIAYIIDPIKNKPRETKTFDITNMLDTAYYIEPYEYITARTYSCFLLRSMPTISKDKKREKTQELSLVDIYAKNTLLCLSIYFNSQNCGLKTGLDLKPFEFSPIKHDSRLIQNYTNKTN